MKHINSADVDTQKYNVCKVWRIDGLALQASLAVWRGNLSIPLAGRLAEQTVKDFYSDFN